MSTTFLALYRGESVGSAKLLALTAEPLLVGEFATRMLDHTEEVDPDPVVQELDNGRRRALRLVRHETKS